MSVQPFIAGTIVPHKPEEAVQPQAGLQQLLAEMIREIQAAKAETDTLRKRVTILDEQSSSRANDVARLSGQVQTLTAQNNALQEQVGAGTQARQLAERQAQTDRQLYLGVLTRLTLREKITRFEDYISNVKKHLALAQEEVENAQIGLSSLSAGAGGFWGLLFGGPVGAAAGVAVGAAAGSIEQAAPQELLKKRDDLQKELKLYQEKLALLKREHQIT